MPTSTTLSETLSNNAMETGVVSAFQIPIKAISAAFKMVSCLLSASLPSLEEGHQSPQRGQRPVLAAWTIGSLGRLWEAVFPDMHHVFSEVHMPCFSLYVYTICQYLTYTVNKRLRANVVSKVAILLSRVVSHFLLLEHLKSYESLYSATCSALFDIVSLDQESSLCFQAFSEHLLPAIQKLSCEDGIMRGLDQETQVISSAQCILSSQANNLNRR